jgi:hypothetical protein
LNRVRDSETLVTEPRVYSSCRGQANEDSSLLGFLTVHNLAREKQFSVALQSESTGLGVPLLELQDLVTEVAEIRVKRPIFVQASYC